MGGIFAAPFLKIFLDAIARLKAVGIFSDAASTTPLGPSDRLSDAEVSP
jgi:hypothetical protein